MTSTYEYTRREFFRNNNCLKIGQCYEIAEFTEKTGSPEEENEQYFTTRPGIYVGQFISSYLISNEKSWWWICTFKTNDNTNCKIEFKYNNLICWREVADTKPNRREVFRISPKEGKYYEYAEYTEKIGVWPNDRYFTTDPLRYVGKHIKHCTQGYGDGADHWDIFEDSGGQAIQIDYTYAGTTSFREVPEPSIIG